MLATPRNGCWITLLAASIVVACGPRRGGGPVARPDHPLELEAARAYMLSLVNRDRAEAGLEPVEHDSIAERAAQRHVEDMAGSGFTAHWGSDGSVPEERYTLAGGVDFVQENAACFFDNERRRLDPSPKFSPLELEKLQAAFMAELPPADGHKRNILKASHTGLGVGLAQPVGIPQPCLAQEFVDRRGEYEPLPKTARVGTKVTVAGEVTAPVEFGGVGVARIEPRKPKSAVELNRTSSYPIPSPYVLYFPKGFRTPKPVELDGKRFTITIPLDDRRRTGRYQVSVWGRYPDSGKELVMVSLRTVEVE